MGQKELPQSVGISVENVGGIDAEEFTLDRGATVLKGENATNRTSFLRSLMAAFGSDDASLKADADSGRVAVDFGDETYTRTLERRGDTTVFGGDPYLEEATTAELFAFLLEQNRVREAVRAGENIHDVIMEPVDTARIRSEIAALKKEREDVADRIRRIEDKRDTLVELAGKRDRLQADLADKRTELEAERDAFEAEVDAVESDKEAYEDELDELQGLQSDLEEVEFRLEKERESLEHAESELEELRIERVEYEKPPEKQLQALEEEIAALREEKQSLSKEIDDIQKVIRFNQDQLSSIEGDWLSELHHTEDADVTDQLVADEEVTCWACRSKKDRSELERTVDLLQELRGEKSERLSEIDSEIADVQERRNDLESDIRHFNDLDRRIDELEDQIGERRDHIDRLEAQKDDLEAEIADQEDLLADLERKVDSHALDKQRSITELEFAVGQVEEELEDVENRIEELEREVGRRDELETRREEIAAELEDLRTRIQSIETEVVEEFNERTDELLGLLDYDNLDRVWLERIVEEGGHDGAIEHTRFDLHIVRSTDDGAVYEDTVDNLSESEREVTGLVLALAGYLVYDVSSELPVMLLDSLEAIDASRIRTLLEYFADHAPYLVVALLPEDAEVVSASFETTEM